MFRGDTIGKYRLIDRLGKGGMGEVWLATASGHGGFSKKVVIKTLLPELTCDPLFIDMLANEARICARLSHPNLIEVFDFTEHGGIYLLAMEYVTGRPLHQILRATRERNMPMPAWLVLRIVWECCRGLEYAHEQGVIHCDLSPSNVMVTLAGVTKILDFGVAHSMAQGARTDLLKGKFSYIAPERLRSLATDRRTDIYSLGVMLYLVFTGHLPFKAANDKELARKIIKTRPRMPSELAPIDPRIEKIIMRAIQPDPAKRYQTVSELLAALTPCLAGQLGTYGQHDVARFVSRLFETTEPDAVVIDLDENSALAIPIEGGGGRLARGSSWNTPIDRSPGDTPSKLFAHVPAPAAEVEDARTTVRNLFSRASTGDELDDPPTTATSEASRSGGFGSYSSARQQAVTIWPWSSSRTKSH